MPIFLFKISSKSFVFAGVGGRGIRATRRLSTFV